MGNVVAFQKKVAKRKKMEWVTTSLLNLNGCYAESQYSPGDPILVQLRQGDTQVLVEAVIRTQADLDELVEQHAVNLAREARLYYLIRGTVRERWLWLWGADWCESQAEVFKLLQQRFSENARQEWVFEQESEIIFKDKERMFNASVKCDWLTTPKYGALLAHRTTPFITAVMKGKLAYLAWLKQEQREHEAAVKKNQQEPIEYVEFDVDAYMEDFKKRHTAFMEKLEREGRRQEPIKLGVPVGGSNLK